MKIRDQVYIISFTSSIIPLVILGFLTFSIFGNEFRNSEKEKVELIFFNGKTFLTELFDDLDSRLNILEDVYREHDVDEVQEYLDIFSERSREVEYFAFGSDQGGMYVGDSVTDIFPQTYDPRIRPWYIGALSTDGYFLSEVFSHAVTGKPAVTISRKVIVKGKTAGVMVALLRIDRLKDFLEKMKVHKVTDFFLVDSHGHTVIATGDSPSNAEYIEENFQELITEGTLHFEDSEHHRIYYPYDLSFSKLTLVGGSLEDELMAPVVRIQKIIFILILITILISTLLTLIFGRRFGNSLKRLSFIIDNIARGDYSKNILKLDDYIDVKSELYLVKEAIKRMQDEIKEREAKLKMISEMDPLTRVFNKGAITDLVNLEIRRATTFGTDFSIIMFDLDHFKNLNDSYGHLFGDTVLSGISDCVSKSLKSSDLFGRYGGEEFIILLPDTRLLGGVALAERLRKKVSALEWKEDTQVTASFGVIEYTESSSFENTINLVDGLLYRAKKNGRNKVEHNK